jgi:hypothetical protein
MTATTVEKGFFIIFGLAVFTAVGLPIYSEIQDTFIYETKTREFDTIVKKVELGIHVVEYNGSARYSSKISWLEKMQIKVIENCWGLRFEYNDSRLHLLQDVFSTYSPIFLEWDNQEMQGELLVERSNECVLVQFL